MNIMLFGVGLIFIVGIVVVIVVVVASSKNENEKTQDSMISVRTKDKE